MPTLLFLISCAIQSSALRLSSTKGGPQDVLYIFEQIDKSGSSTMRQLMQVRSDRHGWAGVGCRIYSWQPGRASQACIDSPSTYVTQDHWFACDAYEGIRPCEHVVLLREPVSRMVSAYNYFCLRCSEWNKFCGRMFKPASCPNISIVEFTRRYANLYTRKFMAAQFGTSPCLHGGDYENDYADSGFTYELAADDWKIALTNLTKPGVHVFQLEDDDFQKKIGLMLNETFQKDRVMNHHSHEYAPSEEELEQMSHLLHSDQLLYASLFNLTDRARIAASASRYLRQDDDDILEWQIEEARSGSSWNKDHPE